MTMPSNDWQVVEEQLRVEQTREAELDLLYQDEAAKVWHQREAEWARERQARERLMDEVNRVLVSLCHLWDA